MRKALIQRLVLKKELVLELLSITVILVLLLLLSYNVFLRFSPQVNLSNENGNQEKFPAGQLVRPTQTALQTIDSYTGIDYHFDPQHDAIADSAVCRGTSTFIYTTFAPALADPEHACSVTVSSDEELASMATLSGRLTQLKILKITNTDNTMLPVAIGNIHSLGRLIITNTHHTVLPPEIGKLTNLIELTLDNTQVTSLPVQIGDLTNLEELNVTNNPELHSMPLEIKKLSFLWKLIFINDSLDSLPVLPNLQQGTVLSLKGNHFRQFPPVLLSGKRVIASLDLSDNQIESIPSQINNTQIRILLMNNNQLTDLPQIDKMNVSILNLSGNKLTRISSLPSSDWLQVLDLSNNKLITLPLSLSNMVHLSSLRLGGNQLAVLPPLPAAKNLKELDISYNNLSSLPEGLGSLRSLLRLNISGNNFSQDDRKKVRQQFPDIELIY